MRAANRMSMFSVFFLTCLYVQKIPLSVNLRFPKNRGQKAAFWRFFFALAAFVPRGGVLGSTVGHPRKQRLLWAKVLLRFLLAE